jgi:thiamine biosynthesis lipoprotein
MTRPVLRVHVRPRMGTWLGITVSAPPPIADGLAAHAFAVATRVELDMSRFDERSALVAVNRAAGSAVAVPRELARAVKAARQLAERTDGAFDPTIGALMEAWRRAAIDGRAPDAAGLAAARALTGWRGLTVRGCRVRLARPGMALDLDGFGKGWAVDRIAASLAAVRGVSALVNFGESSLAALNAPDGPAAWTVVLRDPFGGVVGRLRLRNRACATSATFGRAWRVGRRRRGHVIDPRSGRPVRSAGQATAIADSAAVAEAAATALLVRGPASLGWLTGRLRCELAWIDRRGVVATPGFRLEPAASRATA